MNSPLADQPLTGLIRYNGFTFGPPETTPPNLQLVSEPRYDDAGRAVIGIRYTLTLAAYVTDETEPLTAARLEEIRTLLNRPGRELVLTGIGLGDTTISAEGSHGDLIQGPRPRLLELAPVAGTNTWQLKWQCEFEISEPPEASSGDWLALNFTARYQIDTRGFTTRTIQGYVQLALVRPEEDAHEIDATADAARDALTFIIPSGFRRVGSTWTESADKSRLEFEVIDRELDHQPFPPGIVEAEVDYELRSSAEQGPTVHFSGWMESAADQPENHAAYRLLLLLEDRIERLHQASGELLVPRSIALGRKLFTRRANLTAEYAQAGCLLGVLAASGMWDAIPGSDYLLWKASMEPLWENRGLAELASRLADGVIVDAVDHAITEMTLGSDGGSPTFETTPHTLPSLIPAITPELSWLSFSASLTAIREEAITLHYPAQAVTHTAPDPLLDPGLGDPFTVADPPLREEHGEPRQQVLFEGTARRLQYQPIVPRLVSVGGQTLLPRRRSERRQQVDRYCGVPLYEVIWQITYDLAGAIAAHIPPQSPLENETPATEL